MARAAKHFGSQHSEAPASRWAFRSFRGYRARDIGRDLIAGLTLAAIAIPEQMATAGLGGFAPQIGFFAMIAGSLAFAALGGSRFLSSGADSTITPIFAGGLALLAAQGSPDYAAMAALLALMVGVMLMLSGVFRFGFVADLLSVPVTTGFLVGIAAHIVISQLPAILGVPTPQGAMLQRLLVLLGHLGHADMAPAVTGLGVLAVILIAERIDGRIPGALIALAMASAAVAAFGLSPRVAVLGAVPAASPHLSLPLVDPTAVLRLLPLALIIAVVVMVQTAATSRSFPDHQDRSPDVDRDFVGIGAGSLLAGLIGAFPVNASPPRTAVAAESGARSQLAGIVSVVTALVLLLFGSALLGRVPDAGLAGVLLFVAIRITRVRQMADILRQSPGEFMLVVATAAAIIVLPIEEGVAIGIVLSLLHGIWSITRARAIRFVRVPGSSIWWPTHPDLQGEDVPKVLVIGFQAPLSFLNADLFRRDADALLQAAGSSPRLLVIEATGVVEIDFTAAQVLRGVISRARAAGIDVAIARLESERAHAAMQRYGIVDLLGADHLTRSVEEAVRVFGPDQHQAVPPADTADA
ncbi:SulP family inorganic anion transporter [Bradyrhizobium sp. WD16]|uniref:SulP family inorganic anion transporter n=1 Tax=Bradyrhizobium sp. WD16 TaxID=1521768 RepID=UPI0020A24804|nr:SulP family inorganic anion transporter [Bradyrhizobium sp. WD16]UTD28011.1 SulP family inorganic anion transporter [Bradyrhizobium sp. WD16]